VGSQRIRENKEPKSRIKIVGEHTVVVRKTLKTISTVSHTDQEDVELKEKGSCDKNDAQQEKGGLGA